MEVKKIFSNKALEDYKIIIEAKKGNQNAYTQLLNRYKKAIYYMILKMVKNESDAEDLTLEAFGRAFKKIDQYEPNYAFSTWLFKIATNNCIDFIRKKKEQNFISLDNNSSEYKNQDYYISLQSKELNPEAWMIQEQKINLIKSIVNQLKPRHRLLIELRYFKEYTYDEIAKELDLPTGTVKAQLFRVRERLQNILRKNFQKNEN